MAEACRQILDDCGIKSERLALEWASAAEGPLFVDIITKYINKIKSMGEIGTFEGELPYDDVKRHLNAAVLTAAIPKVRTSFGNLAKKFHELNDYSVYTKEKIRDEVREKFFPVYRSERITQELISLLRSNNRMSISEARDKTGADLEEFEKVVQSLLKKGTIKQEEQDLLMGNISE